MSAAMGMLGRARASQGIAGHPRPPQGIPRPVPDSAGVLERDTQTVLQTHAIRYAAAVLTLATATQLLSMPCDAVTPTDSTVATPSSNR
jgi:hypothetical protein